MNNAAFTTALSARTGLDTNRVAELTRALVDTMADEWAEGNAVNVPTFGLFEVKKKAERIAVNPVSGRRMLVPPKLTLSFRPHSALKDRFR